MRIRIGFYHHSFHFLPFSPLVTQFKTSTKQGAGMKICTSKNGKFCTQPNSSPCPTGECSVTGDIYFQSFDGRIYTFPATCQYVLAKSRNSGKFTVTIQNAPCGAVSQLHVWFQFACTVQRKQCTLATLRFGCCGFTVLRLFICHHIFR